MSPARLPPHRAAAPGGAAGTLPLASAGKREALSDSLEESRERERERET